MYVKTISTGYSRKFNLGDYNSVELDCSIWASIAEGEDEEACMQLLWDKCRESVRGEYKKVMAKSAPVETFTINADPTAKSYQYDDLDEAI